MLTYRDGEPFPGRVGTTLTDSVPAWPVPRHAPDGAPNIVLVVLDDVGFAQLGCYGSDIETPNIDTLAARGLRYRRFHTTAMCSPTRACLLTGRNSHTCGMGGITDLAMGFPGFHGRIPKSCGFVPEVLRQAGWATYAVGKWHLAPSDEQHAAAPRDRWPLGQGFERYYGFIGAETNHFAPDLTIDNHQVALDPPDGYHLTEDLAGRAIGMITDLRAVDIDKPFFLYFALGACHAPHHAPRAWIDRYAGRFDAGWDAWREATHRRQLDMGIVPPGTDLAPRPPWVQEWASLPPAEQRLYARMMEVFAGFLSHADHHVGRLLDFLDATGERDRTFVALLSDNGASAEGGPHGTFNENFIFNALPHDLEKNLEMYDALGGPDTYGHYPWGWALAGNTPYQRWKRETHEGGIGDPLIVAGPVVAAADAGSIRPHYTHAVDIAATILDVCGLRMPAVLDGVAQEPLAGVSILPSVADAAAPEHRTTQYYEQFACRAIYHEGWKAVAFHPMFPYLPDESPFSPFEDDRWELYHVDVDPSECHDLAAAHPERLAELRELWWREAGRYGALPLHSVRAFAPGRPPAVRARQRYVYRPHAAPVSEEVAAPTKLRAHRITADIEVPEGPAAEGVVLAQGGRFGGVSLYLLRGNPHFTYNFAGLMETTLHAREALSPGPHVLAVTLTPAGGLAMDAELAVDGAPADAATIPRTSPLRFSLAGEGLCCGYDDGTPVAEAYASPFRFTGTIHAVVVDLLESADPTDPTDPATATAETRRALLRE
jgi:arylsulfatase A-like enzyme